MSQANQTLQKLDFGEKLIQSGKRENTDALLKRIKTLHQKLAVLEQDLTDVRSLEPVRKPLIDRVILHHKDRGVKAYAACCLADLLRLYAPDAPYTAEELRDIFQFFSTQLLINLRPSQIRPLQPSKSKSNEASQTQSQTAGAASQRITDVPYYTEYTYLLESLATIKSVVLACDVPSGDDLVTGFFEGFVQIVRTDMSKNVIRHLVNILVAVAEESSAMPSGVMDCIIDQFTNYASKPETPSFQLIVDVCNRASDRLQRPIFAHFSEIQLSHGRNPTPDDLKILRDSHSLLLTIWQFAPGLLLNVIPLLEENLRAADEVDLRAITTHTLGFMFGSRPRIGTSVADLAKAYPSTWKAWLGRRLDKSSLVRLTWAESAGGVVKQAPDLRSDVENALVDRIQDSNEQVRAAICKVFGQLEYETTLHHVSVTTLQAVGARMSDKKAVVRAEATSALSKLWADAHSEIAMDEAEAVAHFAWIPETMLHCLQKKDAPLELISQISSVFKEKILPLPEKPDDEEAWVDRLLLVASYLDEAALKGLYRLTGLVGFAKGSSPYRAFISFCEENNGGIINKEEDLIKARLNYVISAIAVKDFVDHDKAKGDLEAFAAANENRLYKLFKSCADPQSDLRTLIKAKNEFLRRIEQSHTELLDTFTKLIDNASFNIINTTSISPLLRTLQSPPAGPRKEATSQAAAKLLSLIAKECAPMYTKHIPELVVLLGQQKNEKLVEVALQALSAACKYDTSDAPRDKKTIKLAQKIALKGTPRQAKFAARLMAYCGHDGASEQLLEDILDDLADKDENRILSHLRALSELALSSPAPLESKADEVHRFIMKEVVHKKSPSSDDDAVDEWIDEDSLAVLDRAKILALRFLTHRALGFARADNALIIAEPVFNLLGSILKQDGEISTETQEGGHAKTHLRLRAALCLLKLAQVKAFDKRMTAFFEPISYIMQDPCYQVRYALLMKMGEVLPRQRMYPRWNIMPAMIATDPEKENVLLAKTIMASCVRACHNIPSLERIERIEMPLARLLLVLSHHPDLTEWSLSNTKDMSKYIELYLDVTLNRDNVGLMYHIANKVKSVKGLDMAGNVDEDSSNLYKLAELSQIIIRNRAEQHHWTITTYPGRVRLPRDTFHNLENNQVVLEVSRRSYLTEEEANWAKSIGRRANATAGPSRREPASSPRKRVWAVNTASRKRSQRTDESDEDEEEDDEDQTSDEAEETDLEEEEEGDAVMGRGGKRGAKTKAKKGLRGKRKRSPLSAKKVKQASDDAMDAAGGEDSDLTAMGEN